MTLTHLDLDRIEGLAGRLRADAAHTGHDSDWFVEHCLRVNSAASDLTAMITRIRELEGALEPLLAAAEGLSHGEDWNNGTHAKHHKYRQKLLDAIAPARTALQRKTP